MNTLIIFAHPEPKSMNGLLKDKAIQTLEALGRPTQVSDLYAQNFQDAIDPVNFPFYQEDFFDLQLAQQQSQQLKQVPPQIQVEQDKLRWADVVIFQYPLWWYSVPAILKAYIDSVFTVGFAYAGANELAGKSFGQQKPKEPSSK